MRISTSLRWLVVAVSAAMLLAVAAACSSETIEVPGETVVVEKEVIKEVMVPGETVVVEKIVTETVEVPGETVVQEVVKTVEVPGETVVVEKIVTETVEVPGPERVVVKEVPGQKYVTDPTTGMTVTAPQYGGTITNVRKEEPAGPDTVISGVWAQAYIGGVTEKLGMADWATPRDKYDFQFHNVPANTRGQLAESWSQPDPLTYIVKVRPGVHWHNKAPMNGRELTAQDIEYNYHRVLGLGSGFTERSPHANSFQGVEVESITATDESTVEFKLKELNLGALAAILDGNMAWMYPPDVIQEHGDVTDWRNVVGTGPMMLTDWAEGSSVTWEKNPDYWGTDEKYPENQLPYVDQLRALFMPEVATYLAALRTGRVDNGYQLRTLDQVESLQKTNPELVIVPFANRSDNGIGMNTQIKPFDDINVRKAMQMAVNVEEINNAYYKGYADTIPQGQLNRSFTEVVTQFEDWPEDVKKVFDYDPEGAEALLDAAGYPRGSDGTRFEAEMVHLERYDLNYVQLVASYWKRIGVDVEPKVHPLAQMVSRRSERDFEMINAEAAGRWFPLVVQQRYTVAAPWNSSNVNDPWYEAKYLEGAAATTIEEYNKIVNELNQYGIEQFWTIWGPMAPQYLVIQPWLIGFNGELTLGNGQYNTVYTRLWIDQELKAAMGR